MSLRLTLLLFSLFSAASGFAQSHLRIGVKLGPSAIDPHYHASGENSSQHPHIFEALTHLDDSYRPVPHLATAWRTIDSTTWEFEIRRGVRFHNGELLTADDVVYTLERIPMVRNSPGSFEIYTKSIASAEATDPHRVLIRTHVPQPYLDIDLSRVLIIPRSLGKDVETADFNAGRAAIGTGPYRFVSWRPGQQLALERNSDYWKGLPEWQFVHLVPIASDPTRVAALLNGEVDLIEHVPLADRQRLASDDSIELFEHDAARVMFVHLDSGRERSPYLTDARGRRLDQNPLRDVRVRRALSIAIDREAIIRYLLEGSGSPAAQVLPDAFAGSSSELRPETYDLTEAKRLLAEAGYPDGFRITLHGPSGRYPNDSKIVQAIAQMWWHSDVITEVATLTPNVFFPTASRQEFSAYFAGWSQITVASALAGLVHSYDDAKGFGSANRARYSNRQVDMLIDEALSSLDAAHRDALLERAQEIAFREDQGLIPLYFPVYAWATRARELRYLPNAEGLTQAMRIRRLTPIAAP